MTAIPHPSNEIAARITELELRGWPDVMVWKPIHTESGCWEAAGDGFLIISEDPSEFADLLAERLGDVTGE
jgi:hypothetical protein